MDSFVKKKIGTLTLGERLRKVRTERRIAIGEASRLTRIQVKYIECLEAGDYDRLPADVYVRGFIRNYADLLALDENAMLKAYEKEREIRRNIKKTNETDEAPKKNKPIRISAFVFTPKKIVLIFMLAGVIAGGFYLYREIGSFTNEPRLVVLGPKNNLETQESFVDVFGATDRDARIFINDQPVLVGDDGKFKESVTLQAGINTINVRSLNRFDKEASQQLTIRANIEGPEEGETIENERGEEDEELRMELRVDPGPVWISVESDGNLVFSGTMLSGSIQSFRAKEKFVVSAGKANATFLKFGSQEEKKLSEEPGAARGVVFDRNTKF